MLTAIGAYAASESFVSSDATTVQLSVIFNDDPYSLPAIQRIALLRTMVSRTLAANGLGGGAATSATFYIAGQTAQLADQLAYNRRDTLLIVPAVLALVLLVLVLLLRSLVAPLYLLLAASLVSCAGGGVQVAPARPTPASHPSLPVLPITAVDYGYEMPTSLNLHASLVDIALVNNGTQPHQAQLARLHDGVTPSQVLDEFVTKRDQRAGFALLTLAGGSDIVAPGYGQETILNLPAGEYALLCLVVGDDGVSHVEKGMIRFFSVAAASAPVTPPASNGVVVMRDSGYVLPAVISTAQALTLRVINQGNEPHEMNIVRLAAGKRLQDLLAFFRSPSGPPPFEEYGGMAALAPNGSGWIKLHLEPGNYALCSLIPDQKTGQLQLERGMIALFSVHTMPA